jgi:hypothetical protein
MKTKKQPSLDETYTPDETGVKLNPYDKLQSLFSDKDDIKLSDSAKEKLDFLLGEEEKPNYLKKIFDKIMNLFSKIDGFIFREKSRIMNNEFHSRKK